MWSVPELMEVVAKWEGVRTRYIQDRLRTTMDKLSAAQTKYELEHWNESWPGAYNTAMLVEASADLTNASACIPDGVFTLQEACLIIQVLEHMWQGVLVWRHRDNMRRKTNRMSMAQVKAQWVQEIKVFDNLRHRPVFAGKMPPKPRWVERSQCDVS